MPKVLFGAETYEVDDDIYRDFLLETVVEGASLYDCLDECLDSNDNEAENLMNYIVYRLAEVDPGFLPQLKNEEVTSE